MHFCATEPKRVCVCVCVCVDEGLSLSHSRDIHYIFPYDLNIMFASDHLNKNLCMFLLVDHDLYYLRIVQLNGFMILFTDRN